MSDPNGYGPAVRGGRGGSPPVRERGATRGRGSVALGSDGDDWFGPQGGPTLRGGRPSRARRIARAVIAVLVIAALAIAATGIALLLTVSASMRRVEVGGLSPAIGQLNVLVVGSDSRADLSPDERGQLTTGSTEGARADTIFVLSLSGGRAAMLSLPRDLLVTRCDGTQGRINAAYGIGGPTCMVETVRSLTNIQLTNYLEVDFGGFARIVDAVGGVTLFLDKPVADRDAGLDLPAGCRRLNGQEALGFVRVRKIDSDFGRIARQQRFVKELAEEVATPATLLNVPRAFGLARAGGQAVAADEGTGPIDLLRMGRAARGLVGRELPAQAVPADLSTVAGASVLVPRADEAAALFTRFRDGSILTESRPAPALQPEQVRVVVRNGAGVAGLAAQGQAYLAERGFAVVDIGNADLVPATVVTHPPGAEEAARLVARQVPGTRTQVTPGAPAEDPVTLVLGPSTDLSAPQQAAPRPPRPPVGAGAVPTNC